MGARGDGARTRRSGAGIGRIVAECPPSTYIEMGPPSRAGSCTASGSSIRSLRASWSAVQADVDGTSGVLALKTARPSRVDVAPGPHRLVVSGPRFEGATLQLDLDEGQDAIVSIEPRYLEGASAESPLGSLVARRVASPQDLGLYRFYAGMPTSRKGGSLTRSVVVSIAVSLAFALAGVAAVLLIPFAWAARSPGVSAILLLPCLFIASALVPMGVGGVIAGSRFLRLPRGWRGESDDQP